MITVYSTPSCHNCAILKTNLKGHGIIFDEKTIGEDITLEELQAMAGIALRAAPVIFKDDKYFGGFVDMPKLLTESLQEMAQTQHAEVEKLIAQAGLSL